MDVGAEIGLAQVDELVHRHFEHGNGAVIILGLIHGLDQGDEPLEGPIRLDEYDLLFEECERCFPIALDRQLKNAAMFLQVRLEDL